MNISSFYAMVFRTKYINRWGLMNNTRTENLAEHSFECAVIAHALALIGNTYFAKQYDADKAALMALYHDAPEIFTGDLPTPIKYYNPAIKQAYKDIEKAAENKLMSLLPSELQAAYEQAVKPQPELQALVKAADKLCAYIKCINETRTGNEEFASAEKSLCQTLDENPLPEVAYFIKHFLPAFSMTIDDNNF